MKRSASRYLALVLLFGGLFAYLDAVPDQLLVVEYQVLFQSGVGDITTVGGLLHRDITVGTQKLHRFGLLLLAPRARPTGQTVVQSQPLPCPLAGLQHFGIVRP